MMNSVWGEALKQCEFDIADAQSFRQMCRTYRFKKRVFQAACLVICLAGITGVNKVLSEKKRPGFDYRAEEGYQTTLNEGKYKVVCYEIPKSYEISALYIKTQATEALLKNARDLVSESRIPYSDQVLKMVGAQFFSITPNQTAPFMLFVPRSVIDDRFAGIQQMYLFSYSAAENDRQFARSIGYTHEGEEPFIDMLNALSGLTSPDTPAMLVMGNHSRYAVIGDTAYCVDLIPDYLGFLPDLLGDCGIKEDDLEIVVIQ